MRYFTVLLVVISFLFSACQMDSATEVKETGTLKIYLTDAPAVYDSVNITFSEVSAHLDSAWINVITDPVIYDLLELRNGKYEVLGSAEVPAGHYTQIRIRIDKAEIGVNGEVFPLDVPGGAQTGLKFGPEFTIEAGSSYELMVDFDVNRSIVTNGPADNIHGYKLKPHLRMVAKAITGSISAKITNPDHIPMAYAIQGTDTVNSATISLTDSTFMLSFLPEGLYTIMVKDTLEQSYRQENVPVTMGVNHNLGLITLQ